MKDKEIKKIAKDMLKRAIGEQVMLEKLIKIENAMERARIKIKEKKFRGTPRTLSNDELAHNGALSLAIQIMDKELNSKKED